MMTCAILLEERTVQINAAFDINERDEDMGTTYYGVLKTSDRCGAKPEVIGNVYDCIKDAVKDLRAEFRVRLSESPDKYKYMHLSGNGMYAKVIHENWNGYTIEWRVVELNAMPSCDDVLKQEVYDATTDQN